MALSFAQMHDVGAWIDAETALLPATITAGAGNDGVAVNGPAFDRLTAGRDQAKTCCLVIFGVATMAITQTLTITAKLQDDTVVGFSAPVDLDPAYPVTTVLNSAGGAITAGKFRVRHDVDIGSARRYVRAVVTANLSNSATDTVSLAAVLILGGQQQFPPA